MITALYSHHLHMLMCCVSVLSRVSASTLTSLKPPRRKVLTKHKLPRVCVVVAMVIFDK